MTPRVIVIAAAWLEIIVGILCITSPSMVCGLLFAAGPEGVGLPLGHLFGVALFALGIACLPSTSAQPSRSIVIGLFAYTLGAATLFAWTAVATTLRGFMLWPAVVLHVTIAGALLPQFLARKLVRTQHMEPTEQL